MQTVIRQFRLQKAGLIHHGGKIIHIGIAALRAKLAQPAVQLQNRRGRPRFAHRETRIDVFVIVTDGKNGSE